MRLARWIFRGAAIYGAIVLLPLLVLETRFGQDNPPPLTHAEFYYGFTVSALAWQLAFWIIGSDPLRYRRMMFAAMAEKFSWGVVVFGLSGAGRVIPATTIVFASIDAVLGLAFVMAWLSTVARSQPAR
jgi:hypothetical protein